MKASLKTVLVSAVLLSLTSLGVLFQRINEQQLQAATQSWQSKVATANFVGQSPQQTLTFLNHQGAVCEPYVSGNVLMDGETTSHRKMGFVTAHAGPVAHTFSMDGLQTWYITIGFNFDSHDNCQSSSITWGPSH